ncbi:hypothetical protein HMPREF1869_01351 [Bacteroidales bacterium KA00251]|nr:hypothetical protein HMPREF1869_01351 [Bacteroidales bacterium KA00251]
MRCKLGSLDFSADATAKGDTQRDTLLFRRELSVAVRHKQ